MNNQTNTKPNIKQPSIKQPNHKQCPVYRKCNGCQLQNMSYEKQLEWKQIKVAKLLDKFGKVNPIIGMDSPYHYRNKVQAAFRMDYRRKQIVSGVFQSSTNAIVPIDDCMIEDKKADEIIVTIRNMMKSFKMQPYDERSHRGFLRHVLVKRGFTSGQVMVVLVSASPIFSSKNNFIKVLLKEHPEITTIILSVCDSETNLLLGNEKVLYGKGTIEDTLCGCKFRISAKSFYQINPLQTEVLYGKAIALAQLTGKETVLDAYCGIGTIGIIASKHAGNVIGVEVNGDAVRDAISNAKLNQIQNIRFFKADASAFINEMTEENENVDVIFMDPPRAGSDERFLASVAKLAPKRVIYISCNPETQERDVLFLTKNGYSVKEIQPVDMFPFTNHVECVVLLERKA